jgi:trigger factor
MIKKLPKSKIEFELVISWDDWKKYLDLAAKEASEEIKISGFRPGKAPRNLVEQKIGKKSILANAADKAVRKGYVDFVIKKNLEVIGQPKVEILEMKEEKDLKIKVNAEIMPEIGIDSKYKKEIKEVNKEYKEKKVEIKDEEMDLELEKLANSRVKLVTVLREARKNDSVEVDFEVKIDNVSIENGTSKNHPLIIGRGVFIPGFEEQLIGMKEQEEKDFELTFPDSYHKKDLAGKLANFHVKMNLVQERQTPEISDDFAKSIGTFKSLEELKKNIKEGMEHEGEHKMKDEKHNAFIEKIIENAHVDLPEILIHEELHKMLEEFEYQIASMNMNLDEYLAKLDKKREDLEKDWEPQAKKRVISALALKEIAKLEKIEASSAEIEAEMNKVTAHYKNVKDFEKNIDMERLYNYCKGTIENQKVFDYLDTL